MVPSHQPLLRGDWPDSQYKRFVKFVGSLSETFACPLQVPLDLKYSGLKKFCSDLIEGLPHPFTRAFSAAHLGSDARMSISFSLFLYRKTLPSAQPDVHSFMDRMSEPSPPCDRDLLSFCKTWVRRNMRAWDRGYYERTTNQVIPTTACGEFGRNEMGSRGSKPGTRFDRDEYVSYCTLSETPNRVSLDNSPLRSRVLPVESGGKWRIISAPPATDNHLRPLHQTLYDRLSRFEWLLRGDAKPSRFKRFTRVPGEVYVSGDYESATDNLNMEFQAELLRALLDECVETPEGVKQHAMMSFTDNVLQCGAPRGSCQGDSRNGGVACCVSPYTTRQRRGQMMGQLLSFPLLCLVNYLTFLYLVGDSVPVKINGDDIVARMTVEQCSTWMEGVSKSGLTLSKGKTLVHPKFFTLNSTLFKGTSGKISFCPFVRARCISRHEEGTIEAISSLPGRFKALTVGLGRRRRFPFVREFLEANSHTIYCTRRSVTRGLGLRVNKNELIASGLWNRELFYLRTPEEPELPPKVSDLSVGGIPEGFVAKSSSHLPPSIIRANEDRMGMMMTRQHWENEVLKKQDVEDLWWGRLRQGCSPWGLGSLLGKKVLRMLRMKRNEAWKYVYMRNDPSLFGRGRMTKGKTTWVWQPSLQKIDGKSQGTELTLPASFEGEIKIMEGSGFSFCWSPPACLA